MQIEEQTDVILLKLSHDALDIKGRESLLHVDQHTRAMSAVAGLQQEKRKGTVCRTPQLQTEIPQEPSQHPNPNVKVKSEMSTQKEQKARWKGSENQEVKEGRRKDEGKE